MSAPATRCDHRGLFAVLGIVAATSSCQFISGLVRFESDDAGGGGSDTSGGAGGTTSSSLGGTGGSSDGGSGGSEPPFVVVEGLTKPADIAIRGETLYFLERGTLFQSDGAVWTWPLDDVEEASRLVVDLDFPAALALSDDALFFALRSSPVAQRTLLPSGTTAPFVTGTDYVRDLEVSEGELYVASTNLERYPLSGGAATPILAFTYAEIALGGGLGYAIGGAEVFRFQPMGNPSPEVVFGSKAVGAIASGPNHAFAICNGQLQWRAHDDSAAGTIDVGAVTHIAADPFDPARVFWTNGGEVGTATVTGEDAVLANGFLNVYGIAVDETHVYVTDMGLGRVTRIPR